MLHVDVPTPADLVDLVETRGEVCISLYVPTTPLTQHADVSRLEYRRLVEAGIEEARAAGRAKNEVAAMDDLLRDVLDDAEFWRFQANSLAVFATPRTLRTFRLPSRLTATAQVSDRFHLKPLIRAVTFPGVAYVLALSLNAVRLIEVVPEGPSEEVAVPGLPAGLAQVVAGTDRRSSNPAVRTGEGQKILTRKFARAVDQALRDLLAGRDTPLVLATVEEHAPLYRSVNTYPHLADEIIPGNAEHLSAGDLAERAREILRRRDASRLATLRERFEAWRGNGRASTDLAQIARAATAGAVHTLLADIDRSVPGHMDPDMGEVTFAEAQGASSYDLVDEVLGRTLVTGGTVLGVRKDDLPDPRSPVAALLRYPV